MKRTLLLTMTIAALGATLVSTGAFVDTPQGDPDVEMAPSDGPNSVYAVNDSGEIELDLSAANQKLADDAEGLNENSHTEIRNIFTIRYAGDGDDGADVWIETPEEPAYDDIEFIHGTDAVRSIEGNSNNVTVRRDNHLHIGLVVDTTGDHAVEDVSEFTVRVESRGGDDDGNDDGGDDDGPPRDDTDDEEDEDRREDEGQGEGEEDEDGKKEAGETGGDERQEADGQEETVGTEEVAERGEIGETDDVAANTDDDTGLLSTGTRPDFPGPDETLGGFFRRTVLLLVAFVVAGATVFSVARSGVGRIE